MNLLLVGFGQKVCLPINPRCRDCLVNSLCPTGRANLRYVKDPNKFHELPPLKTVEQLRREDEAVADHVLHSQPQHAAAAGIKMEDEPMLAATDPPAVSSSAAAAAAAASASSASAATPFTPPVKSEAGVKLESSSAVSPTRASSAHRPVKIEPALDAAAAAGGSGAQANNDVRLRSAFLRQKDPS